jgi:hypothetical protein
VSFVQTDTTTQGNWKGVYGVDGYNSVNDATSYPSYAKVAASGQSSYTWASSTSDPRGLQKVAVNDRLAATWYAGSLFTIDLNMTDNAIHRVALYCLDWDTTVRAQRFDIVDASSNALLDSRSLSFFSKGKYLVWNIKGHVKINVTRTRGDNAVVSAIYFDSGSASAGFVQLDTTILGNWSSAYGADAHNTGDSSLNYPSYAQVSAAGQSSYMWVRSTSDVRGLQNAASSDSIAALVRRFDVYHRSESY